MKKILVADKIAPAGVAFLKQQGCFEVIEAYGSPSEKIAELACDVDAILVRSETRITREIMAGAKKLTCIGRAGVGVDNIDLEAATERGIIVMNTPSGNTIATAELTFTHILCCARPVPAAAATMREGKWDRKNFSGTELFGKTLGILGLGRIGTEVAKRALAFGMTVLAYDPYLTEARSKALGITPATKEQVFENADYITVHMPLTEQTENMIDAGAFEKMKKGVRIVNVARGGLVNEKALADAITAGKVAAAGFDVFTEEPLPADSPLRALKNLTLTPHLGASTSEAQESVGVEIAEAVAQVLAGGVIRNAVNMPSVDPHALQQLRPFLSLAERLGTLLQQLAPARVEKLNFTLWGTPASTDALPVARAIQRGFLLRIGEHVNDVNAPHLLKRMGIDVQVTQSNSEADYRELIRVEAVCEGGATCLLEGTVIGKNHAPRIVTLNRHKLEFSPEGTLLILENKDVPGIVGALGTILGQAGVNIATMSLSRPEDAGEALAVYRLDSFPSEQTLNIIRENPAISRAKVISAPPAI